jgi:hypothetical protein
MRGERARGSLALVRAKIVAPRKGCGTEGLFVQIA